MNSIPVLYINGTILYTGDIHNELFSLYNENYLQYKNEWIFNLNNINMPINWDDCIQLNIPCAQLILWPNNICELLALYAGDFYNISQVISKKFNCKIYSYNPSICFLIKIANNKQDFWSSEEYTNGEKYYPTQEEILDSYQEPFNKIIKPRENQIKQFLFKEVKRLMTAQVRHYIHKHKDESIEKLYNFVISKINFYLILNNLIWSSFETLELIDDNTISEKQLQYDFINYMKKYFSLYIHLLIDKYKNEIILNFNQQQKNKNYNTDPYIRTPEQLDLLIDDVGDFIQLDNGFNINYKCRDSAFIFVRDEAFIGG